jgi:hypothetical protein
MPMEEMGKKLTKSPNFCSKIHEELMHMLKFGAVQKNVGMLVHTLNFGTAWKNVGVWMRTQNFGATRKNVGVRTKIWRRVNVGVKVRALNLALCGVHTHNKVHGMCKHIIIPCVVCTV